MSQKECENTSKDESMLKEGLMGRKKRILAIKDPIERNREIAYFVYDTLYDMRRAEVPKPPKEYTDFMAHSPNDRKKAIAGGFYGDNPNVQVFLDKREFAKIQDRDNVQWLKGCQNYLNSDDFKRRSAIDDKIKELSGEQPKQAYDINWHEKE